MDGTLARLVPAGLCWGLVAGLLLWQHRRSGVVFVLALLPLEFAFWIGFSLPLGFPVGVVRAGLLFVALRRRVHS